MDPIHLEERGRRDTKGQKEKQTRDTGRGGEERQRRKKQIVEQIVVGLTGYVTIPGGEREKKRDRKTKQKKKRGKGKRKYKDRNIGSRNRDDGNKKCGN